MHKTSNFTVTLYDNVELKTSTNFVTIYLGFHKVVQFKVLNFRIPTVISANIIIIVNVTEMSRSCNRLRRARVLDKLTVALLDSKFLSLH